MKIEANVTQTIGSPQLTPRAAQAVAMAKGKAEQLTTTPANGDTSLAQAVQKIYRAQLPADTRIALSVDDETGLVIGTVIDRGTGKVLRQIPSEEMVRLARATREELGPLVNLKS
jgi:flagellar protein FlaG